MDAIQKTESLISISQELRAKLASDLYRPRYHFMPPEAWMNDINGAIYWKGRYHIFYQYNPEGGYWKWMQWGHASSTDMVHWVHHPIALKPDLDGPDREGCFSGGAFITQEGIPAFIYHGVPDGTCLAFSEDDLLIHWKKHPANPVIRVPGKSDDGYNHYRVFDPCAWREGQVYYALVGNTVPGIERDATSLFKSTNLVDWEYVGPFYYPRPEWTESNEDCAVPDFFPLGNRHMLLFNSHLMGTQYYLGKLKGNRFDPESHSRLSWPGGQLGGSRTLLDARGRRIYFDWLRELRGQECERQAGWSGIMTLPIIISIGLDGNPTFTPIPELEILRMNPRQLTDISMRANTELVLNDNQSESLELLAEIEIDSPGEYGLHLRRSPDSKEQTSITVVPGDGVMKIDVSHSSLDPTIKYYHYRGQPSNGHNISNYEVKSQEAPFKLTAKERLCLHIYLDHSVLEVFANGRQYLAQRIYPTRNDSIGTALFCHGSGMKVRRLQAWDMAPSF